MGRSSLVLSSVKLKKPFAVFCVAAELKPAIVLIDELDALCPSRGENVQNSGGSSGEGGEEGI